MPFALVFIGMLLIVTGFQNTYQQFGTLVAGDFTGSPNFFTWLLAIAVIGGIGYYKPLEGLSRGFMGLMILVLILTKGTGFAAQLNASLAKGAASVDPEIGAALPAPTSTSNKSGNSSGGSSGLGSLIQGAGAVASVAALF